MSVLAQIILTAVILAVTFLLAVVGFQVFQILIEFRQALKRLNTILANTQTLSEVSAKPVSAVNQFFSEVRTLVDKTEDNIISATPDRVLTQSHSHPQVIQEPEPTSVSIPHLPHRHFFRRSGSPLRPS